MGLHVSVLGSDPADAQRPMGLDEALSVIASLAERGGPQRHEYGLFWRACEGFGQAKAGGHISDDEHREFFASLGPAGTPESLMGHIFHKPYGYAGDFDIIDKLYTRHVSAHPMVTRWDEFVQAVPSSESVRNRGPYLLRTVRELLDQRPNGRPLRVVSLGSGPGRDVERALDGLGNLANRVHVTLVDMDERAIAHSRHVLARFNGTVGFARADVLRLNLDDPVDLIWSSGLFDYFSDRAFITTLKRLRRHVAPGGRIVIGNFSEQCGGPGPLSFGEWHLVVRSRENLSALAAQAGAAGVRVDAEPTGLNLFVVAEG